LNFNIFKQVKIMARGGARFAVPPKRIINRSAASGKQPAKRLKQSSLPSGTPSPAGTSERSPFLSESPVSQQSVVVTARDPAAGILASNSFRAVSQGTSSFPLRC